MSTFNTCLVSPPPRTSETFVRLAVTLIQKQQCADLQKVLYLTMRFAKTIKQIQGLQAYHAGDKLNVEVRLIS